MKRLAIGILAAGLACSAAEFPMQQQSPKSTNSPENQDVPHQTPGSNNPDLQPEHKRAPKQKQKSTTPEDVPHQQPGTNNPDLGNQQKPKPRNHGKNRKTTSTTSTTQTS